MGAVTDEGRRVIAEIAQRYGLSQDAVEHMARAVANGGGSMAQFNIPELGGSGQWMAGGMTMVGDMFNHGLQATVSGLCVELSNAMAQAPFFVVAHASSSGGWWPPELGAPASVGGQNQVRYAYFPQARRLAVDNGGGEIILLDTGEHQIGGFSQQQSGPQTGLGDPFVGLTFSSQFGQFALSSLPRVGAPAAAPTPEQFTPEPPAPPAEPYIDPVAPPSPIEAVQSAAPPTGDASAILDTIARLAALRDGGALTEDEFAAKKAELLARL